MFLDCANVEDLWLHVAETMIYFLDKHFPLCPTFWLFGHNPNIISAIAVAATTEWKKTILKRWFEHNIVRNKVGAVLFRDICLWKNKLSNFLGCSNIAHTHFLISQNGKCNFH